jgi:hypothetical protein
MVAAVGGEKQSAAALKVSPGELPQASAIEARVVTAMNDPNGQGLEAFHGATVGTDVTPGDFIEQGAIVNRVAGK